MVAKRDIQKQAATEAHAKEVITLKQKLKQEIYEEFAKEARADIEAKIKEEWRQKLS